MRRCSVPIFCRSTSPEIWEEGGGLPPWARPWLWGSLISVLLVLLPALFSPVLAADQDTDGDTISDVDEGYIDGVNDVDTDLDGLPDYQDSDSDGDGISDAIEAGDADVSSPPLDTDNDQIPDFRDWDSDNDNLPDALEDPNGNGMIDPGETNPRNPDSDGDGLLDGQEDKNRNGRIDPSESNPMNPDTDGDGIKDAQDLCPTQPEDFDSIQDGDGCPENDADQDGVPDGVEKGHRCLDPLNPDTDADGLRDGQEDKNGNGKVDPNETNPCNKDTDGDGIIDINDRCPLVPEDFDGYQDRDGCPDHVQRPGVDGGFADGKDTDGDELPDELEKQSCTDWLNPDTDSDGKPDGREDANHNGTFDPGETDPCSPDVNPMGGAGCAVAPFAVSSIIALIGLAFLVPLLLLWRRRRQR